MGVFIGMQLIFFMASIFGWYGAPQVIKISLGKIRVSLYRRTLQQPLLTTSTYDQQSFDLLLGAEVVRSDVGYCR